MALKIVVLFALVAAASAQNYKVCLSSVSSSAACQLLDSQDAEVTCIPNMASRVDCALQLTRGEVDFGYFTEEELQVLAQMQPADHRVVATIRDATKTDNVSFEAVAVVANTHTGGLDGLSNKKYCHPGLSTTGTWSPRVQKTLEQVAAGTDRCPGGDSNGRTAEEMEAATLSQFFTEACRPGIWSANVTLDAELKRQFPSLCSLCGTNSTCDRYTLDMGANIAGVSNDNTHIQALQCLLNGGDVAYVAWQHVREFFNIRNPDAANNYSLLCPDGSLVALASNILTNSTSPCAFVKQPWGAIVASSTRATQVAASLQTWWPNGTPSGAAWRTQLYNNLVPVSTNTIAVFETTLNTPATFLANTRVVTNIDAAPTPCVPARRWCTISNDELAKCNWLRTSAYVLGIQPTISCIQDTSVFKCLARIKDNQADIMAAPANYGYLARQHYRLTPVKLVQNSRGNSNSFSRVAALVRNSAALAANVTRFGNMRGLRACFPEFGGISYMSFVRVAQELSLISSSECDYSRAVGEFFGSACAPGARDAEHSLSDSTYDTTNLCSVCKSTNATSNFTCDWNYRDNMYFGNNGSLSCLADGADVAFVDIQNINSYLSALNLDANTFRVLCRNDTLANNSGVIVDDACLLSYVVDSEVLTRRNDPAFNSISTLLDTLETYFGYAAASGTQLVNLEIYSSFDNKNDLLFKNTAVGLSEPSLASSNEPARAYIQLFEHLQACTGAGSNIPVPGLANRSFYSIVTLIVTSLLTRFIVY